MRLVLDGSEKIGGNFIRNDINSGAPTWGTAHPPVGVKSYGPRPSATTCYVYWCKERMSRHLHQLNRMANTTAKSGSKQSITKSDVEIVADLKSQLNQQHASDTGKVYFRDGVPEDKASAIFTEGSRFYALLTKTQCVANGGDPDKWKRLAETRDLYLAGKKFAAFADSKRG